jgi:hypothetical protein
MLKTAHIISPFIFWLNYVYIKINKMFCFRIPELTEYSYAVPIYEGLLSLFVIANFAMATFMDPGTYPRGEVVCCQYKFAWSISDTRTCPTSQRYHE